MSILVPVPPEMIAGKPPHGSPCTRCGACCYALLCDVARHVFKRPEKPARGPCPALRVEYGQASCGLVSELKDRGLPNMADAVSLLIGAGDGCDARFNGEPPNSEFYNKLEKLDRKRATEIRRARQLLGVSDESSTVLHEASEAIPAAKID